MNQEAASVPHGSDGLLCYPFGNGAERVLSNTNPGASIKGMQFNRHTRAHVARAVQEGIVFSLKYGIDIMEEMGVAVKTVRAGHTNMFLSDVFATAFANTTGAVVELYNTDGAVGAARAAGVGASIFKDYAASFEGMAKTKTVSPDPQKSQYYVQAFGKWKEGL
jgi:xylulokinase